MHIIIKTKLESSIIITIGYKDKLGWSISFIDVMREYYDNKGEVEFVKIYCSFFKHYKFWRRGEWFLFKLY